MHYLSTTNGTRAMERLHLFHHVFTCALNNLEVLESSYSRWLQAMSRLWAMAGRGIPLRTALPWCPPKCALGFSAWLERAVVRDNRPGQPGAAEQATKGASE